MKSVLSFATTLSFAVAASATTIEVSPASNSILQGETVNLNVQIADVTDLYAYQFALVGGSLIPTSVSEGSFLSSGGATFFTSGIGGITTNTANTLLGPVPGVSGSGILATIRFTGPFTGTSVLTPINVILLNSALDEIPADVQTGSVTVIGPIPEPNSGLLLGSVFALSLLGHYWRMRRQATFCSTACSLESPDCDELLDYPTNKDQINMAGRA